MDSINVNRYQKSTKISRNGQNRSKNCPVKPLKNALKMSQISAKYVKNMRILTDLYSKWDTISWEKTCHFAQSKRMIWKSHFHVIKMRRKLLTAYAQQNY